MPSARSAIALLLTAVFALGSTTYIVQQAGEDVPFSQPVLLQPRAAGAVRGEGSGPEQEGGPVANALSIPNLMERPLEGSGFTLGRVLAETASYTRHYITYKSGNLTISGIMNIPKGEAPFPLLILNHGYIDTSVYTNGRGLRREQDYFASRGFAVLHPDYRCHAQSDCAEMDDLERRFGYVRDVMNAVDAVRKANLPGVDARRVGMLGHSMGGGVTINALVAKPDLIAAAMLYAPVSADAQENFARWTERRPAEAQKVIATYGTPDANPMFWDDYSAKNFLSHITAPVQIHHGTADDSVPLAWSEDLQRDLLALGKQSELFTYPGEPHEFAAAWGTVMQRTEAFFRAALTER